MVQHSPLKRSFQLMIILIMFLTAKLHLVLGARGEIGVDYGLNGDNLPSAEQTVALLKSKGIARVRMYEARQEITKAFANSGIELLLGIPNELVPKIAANLAEALNWVTQNVVSFPKSSISAIIVGNEWLLDPSHDPSLLLPAMLNVYTILTTTQLLSLDLSSIKVSTSHALNVLGISFPPSAGQFDVGLLSVLSPILNFLEQTGSFFMVNIFPYFAYVDDLNVSLDFALFEAKEPVQDPKTGLNYTNLFDLQLDAVYAALDGHAALKVRKRKDQDNGKTREWTLDKEKEEDNFSPHVWTLNRRAQRSSAKASRRRPRVIVGESGWPSGAGGSGSVPHAATQGVTPPADDIIFGQRTQERGVVVQCGHSSAATSNSTAAERADDDTERAGDVKKPSACGEVQAVQAANTSTSCGFSARVCRAATVENARKYNQNLIRHVLKSGGTPGDPTTPIQAFIFALYNEDLKSPGPEQHYGLFFPNATPVYPITFH